MRFDHKCIIFIQMKQNGIEEVKTFRNSYSYKCLSQFFCVNQSKSMKAQFFLQTVQPT